MVQLIGDQDEAEEFISDIEHVAIPRQEFGISDAACYQYTSTIYIWHQEDAPIHIIGHEVAHATFYLMDTVHLNVMDQEAFCYLFEFILEQCLKINE